MAPIVVPIIIGTAVVGGRPIAVIGRPVVTRAVAVIAIARAIIAVRTVRAGRGAGGECAGGQTESQSGANAPRLSRRWRRPWQPPPKLLAFFSCASPHSEHRRNNANGFQWLQGTRFLPLKSCGYSLPALRPTQGTASSSRVALLPEIFADDSAVGLSPTGPHEQLPQLRLEAYANRREFSHHHRLT